ncbi:PREDICTED: protein GIGANTEA-like isoform X2 [Lupinus angustifolius]|uniref:protein GIGANTEA-like isoform X2 n=1 Tax=Lupinus angustifolius TaxID=3871 RepID=UPI00092F0BAF|nr:PREDICTED: protein GIGANTEA-like isoform X2 [Lupinus angustifolius]
MASSRSRERLIECLQFSSLFWPPPLDDQQRKDQVAAYVKYFGQFTPEQFDDDIAKLIHSHYPSRELLLFDHVLAVLVLHHPEHGHAVVHPIISCIIDGTLVYDKTSPPFASFISLVCPKSENDYSEQWALACGEILRILTHYNRPIYKMERQYCETETSIAESHATTSEFLERESGHNSLMQQDKKPIRPLTPWITDILLAAPLGIKSDYFRWCSGVMGKYAAGELKPPTTASSRGSGKHPQPMPSTPRWAIANGAGVILSVCDEEVASYETATLTAAAVPALLLPPPATALDEELVAGLPALEPYARLFHRYYALATPSATQKLLLGLLEAPPSWAPDALDAAVKLVELLQAAEYYDSGIRLPRNWIHFHFLHAIGTAMSMRAGLAADVAAALLFRILSQPALLFPPLRQVDGVEVQHEPLGGYISSYRKQIEAPAAEETIEATAQGIASMLCTYGPEVEWRICTIWEAAYGLIPLNSAAVDLPDIVVATPLQPPILSWNLYIPLLKVLEYLPHGSPSEACLMKIFVTTVESILQRTFPDESTSEQNRKTRYLSGTGSAFKNLAVAELRTMVHSLFVESCASVELASRLLFVVLTVCISHEAQFNGSKKPRGENSYPTEEMIEEVQAISESHKENKNRKTKKQGPVAAFDSYVLAAVCALACELQLFPLVSLGNNHSVSNNVQDGIDSARNHTHRILAILEALFSLKPSSVGTPWSCSSNEIVAAAMVAAHISELFIRSKACKHALSILMSCKWDSEIHSRASSLYKLIDIHSKAVASIVNKAEPLGATIIQMLVSKDSLDSRKEDRCESSSSFGPGKTSISPSKESAPSELHKSEKTLCSNEISGCTSRKGVTDFPLIASDIANFLTVDRHIGFNCTDQIYLRSMLADKQELCFSVVSLLWHKLIASPETQPCAESTSAQQGWRQAERELQPWITKDDDQGQKMWRINKRIVKLMVELLRNRDSAESLVIVASASDLLLRATDGMLVDGVDCTLPQLELLEAAARAVRPVLELGESGLEVVNGLSNLLKCRLPVTIRCLSHPSAHARALSTSVLRAMLRISSIRSSLYPPRKNGIHDQCFNLNFIDWQADIEKCLTWEAHSRRANGLSIEFLDTTAKELGCTISM